MKKSFIVLALLVSLAVAGFLSPHASPNPDGLDKVAEDHGFVDRAVSLFSSPLPDYTIPGVSSEAVSTALAGITGVLITFGLSYGVGKVIQNRKKQTS